MQTKRGPSMKPLPEQRVRLKITLACGAAEFEKLKQGQTADMDSRWTIFYEEPWLYVHRGWGHAIFWVRFAQEGTRYRATEAWMTRDPDVIPSDWTWQMGCENEDANAAYLMIKLHGLITAGTGAVPPEALVERWQQGVPPEMRQKRQR